MPEVVKNNETGILVPSKNSKKLGEALIWLLENEFERVKMGKNGRKLGKNFLHGTKQLRKLFQYIKQL